MWKWCPCAICAPPHNPTYPTTLHSYSFAWKIKHMQSIEVLWKFAPVCVICELQSHSLANNNKGERKGKVFFSLDLRVKHETTLFYEAKWSDFPHSGWSLPSHHLCNIHVAFSGHFFLPSDSHDSSGPKRCSSSLMKGLRSSPNLRVIVKEKEMNDMCGLKH